MTQNRPESKAHDSVVVGDQNTHWWANGDISAAESQRERRKARSHVESSGKGKFVPSGKARSRTGNFLNFDSTPNRRASGEGPPKASSLMGSRHYRMGYFYEQKYS